VALTDVPTETLVLRFDARREQEGVALHWEFPPGSAVVHTTLERAERLDGEWTPLAAFPVADAGSCDWLDRSVRIDRDAWYRLAIQTIAGVDAQVGPVHVDAWIPGGVTRLLAMGPTPANRELDVRWVQLAEGPAELRVVDVQGRTAATLFDEIGSAGSHAARWGIPPSLRPGVYFLRFVAGGRAETRRIVVMR
jgi:hypothetical protein